MRGLASSRRSSARLHEPFGWRVLLRWLAGVALAGGVFVGLLLLLAALSRPSLSSGDEAYSPEEVARAERARNVGFDPADIGALPRIQRAVDYTQGEQAAFFPKGEAPVLAELVREGKLPPVAERVGPEPLVLDGGSIGKYGGTWLRAATSEFDVFIVEFRFGYPSLVRWSPLGYPIVPHIATSIEASPDQRQFTIHLRRGIRWSDGHPFSADDLAFWWHYDETNKSVGDELPPQWLVIRGGQTRFEKLDSHTVRFSFEHPFGNFMEVMAANSYVMAAAPAHYLRQYHPDTGDPAFIQREVAALGMSSPRALYSNIKRFSNPECPRLWPWVPSASSANPPYVYVRNPYYFAVDPAGNQLPYIDRVQFDVKSSQMLSLTFVNGEVTMQGRHVRYENYTELMARQKEGGYRVLHWYPASRSSWLIHPNLNRRVDPEEPATAHKARLLADKRFRQALSLALDRAAMIKADFNDQVRAAQVEPGPESPFHNERLAKAFVEHDPERANRLLDELGLTGRDVDGMRTFPDGSTMTFYLTFTSFNGVGVGQFVVDDWSRVGVRVILREQSRSLFYTKKNAADFDMMVWSSESDFFPLLEPRMFAPPDTEAFYATVWGRWFSLGGFYGSPAAANVDNARGPPPEHPMYAAYRAYVEARALPTLDAQVARFQEALDIAADNVWTINIAESPPFLVVANAGLRNVPDNALHAASARTPANAGIETYYFEQPSSAAFAATKAALEAPARLPRVETASSKAPAPGLALERLIRWSLLGIGSLFLLLLALRHPFVARRLVILVPTLLAISLVVFVLIQLPPGDFLTSRIVLLEETGDTSSQREIEDLKRLFHFDEPAYQQYLRWMGFKWFTSFDAADAGLLQGNMGRSMETSRPVNEMVGDRIWLTIAISLGTILFTWGTAIPIGVYSAVRQYSLGDYLITFIGFVGMSVPPFLLALVLMVAAGVSGLFSPEYAAQPGWSWGKVLDLLHHIWVPIVVTGVAGTAGLVRVMRANLLDELQKPYVVTARAKGVRPLKLLFKYPVRVALNPFVSGIGQLFPQLVSGGAIVGIVLSLPTVGPLQVSALFSEDMYLAGSMLMVLSLLGVFGTLVADLLLLWLDPRIRFEKREAR